MVQTQQRAPLERTQTVDGIEYRKHVASFATGVAVVTSTTPEGDVHGVTINSFSSISLEPPTVMISLREGRSHDAIMASGRFGVSVLTDCQREHSVHFAGNKNQTERPDVEVRNLVPTLKECLAWFECEVTRTVVVHDHILIFGEVVACGSNEGDPLLFFASQYTKRASGNEW